MIVDESTPSGKIPLIWIGPYEAGDSTRWDSYCKHRSELRFDGLYCWCVYVDKVFLPTYIGMSAQKYEGVYGRVHQGVGNYIDGKHTPRVDVREFMEGRRLVLDCQHDTTSIERGESENIQSQYKAAVDASCLFFARVPECDEKISALERLTIERVQKSGLDVEPTNKAEQGQGHYGRLLYNATYKNPPACKVTAEVNHHCKYTIRAITP